MKENSPYPSVDNRHRPARTSRARNQRQTLITILVTILTLLIIYRTGVLKSIGFAPNSNATKVKLSNLSKVLEDSNFLIKYPTNWKELSPRELVAFKNEFFTGITRSKPLAFMGIKKKASNGNASTLKAIPAVLDKILADDLKNFKRLRADTIRINNRPVLKYVYTFNSNKGIAIEQQQYIILNNKKVYYLLFHMKKSDVAALQPEIESIANSFLIK